MEEAGNVGDRGGLEGEGLFPRKAGREARGEAAGIAITVPHPSLRSLLHGVRKFEERTAMAVGSLNEVLRHPMVYDLEESNSFASLTCLFHHLGDGLWVL